MSNADKLKFRYSVIEFAEDFIDFQLNFKKPEEVSINLDPERLIVKLKGFRDE